MVYSEGQDAYFLGKSMEDNPYNFGTYEFQLWDMGYRDAEWGYLYQTTM